MLVDNSMFNVEKTAFQLNLEFFMVGVGGPFDFKSKHLRLETLDLDFGLKIIFVDNEIIWLSGHKTIHLFILSQIRKSILFGIFSVNLFSCGSNLTLSTNAEYVRHYLKLSQQLISCFCHFLNNSTTLVLLELKKTSYFLMKY